MSQNKAKDVKPYVGALTPSQAATAIQAARLNATDLIDTADLLFTMKRFSHSVAFSTLAIEEAAKWPLIMMVLLGFGDCAKSWKSYRTHRAKTTFLNAAIESRVRATFPRIPREEAKKIGEAGPTPDQLETSKQLALYSDCIESAGIFVCHLPRMVDWREQAWERLCEARSLAFSMRDYPPQELEVWLKHLQSNTSATNASEVLSELHNELLQKGFVAKGWWDTLLQDVEHETQQRS